MISLWALTASAGELGADDRDALARRMHEWLGAGHDGIALTTCHRVELYGLGAAPDLSAPSMRSGAGSISHLLRVAAGLESAIVGEDEVLHQVREALRHARAHRRLDFRLQRAFETAIATGRRARSRRTESSGNLAQSAVAWLGEKSSLAGKLVVVAGAGRMGAALAHSAANAGGKIAVASRDPDRAAKLARLYAGKGFDLANGAELTKEAGAVAVALGGTWSELAAVDGFDLPPIADISAPQAVPDLVRARLDGSFLGIDDLYARSAELPGAYMKDAETLVAQKTDEYMSWLGRIR